MAGLQTGTTFIDGNTYVAADLNNAVNNAVPLSTLITQWSQKTSPGVSDKFLISDASNGGALVYTTLGNISAGLGISKVSYSISETGIANAYIIAGTPTVSSLTSGQLIIFQPTNINTGASTLVVDSNIATNIYNKGLALTGGELTPANYVLLLYDGTQFDLVSTTPVLIGDNGTLGSGIQGVCPAPPQNSLAKNWYLGAGGTFSPPIIKTPSGRLTLTTLVPVMVSAVTSATTIYYCDYQGDYKVPIYDGTNWGNYYTTGTPSSPQLAIGLDNNSGHTNYHQSGKLFDIFIFNNAGTITLGTGPAWTSSTARGAGAGTTEVHRLAGVWANKNAIALKIDNTTTSINVSADQATYLGTFYATANGQTGMTFKLAATGGGNNILGLYNAYNRINFALTSADSTASWSYGTNTWRQTNASASNRISFVDGLQQSFIKTSVQQQISTSTAFGIGVQLNATSGVPNYVEAVANSNSSAFVTEIFTPQLGFNFMQQMECATAGGAVTVLGVNASYQASALNVSLDM